MAKRIPYRLTCLIIFILLTAVACTSPEESEDNSQLPTIVAEVLTAVATNNPPATVTLPPPTPLPASPTAVPPSATPRPTDTLTPPPTETSPPPTGTIPPPVNSEIAGNDLAILPNRVFIYPVPELFDGDQVTFQFVIRLPASLNPDQVSSQLLLDGQVLKDAQGLPARNLGGDISGIFQWVWDTTGQIGNHQVEIILDPADAIQVGDENPDNNYYATTVMVQPRSKLPTVEQDARWIARETTYATIYVVSGTAAARDLSQLASLTDEAIATAAAKLETEPRRKLKFFFVDRVIGQGGYAAGSTVISYLDRNYSGGNLREVLVHETVHLLDQQFAPQNRLPFLAEGISVWTAGGHYKPEDLSARARALRDSGLYVPLSNLINDFYPVQHEIGYLEAGAFFQYLIDQYGWPAVKQFYSDVQPEGYSSYAAAVDANLQSYFGRSLPQIEQEWLLYLDSLPYDRDVLVDVNTTIRFYNLMRHYQLAYDPTAYFRLAWLPVPDELVNRGLTADINRHPDAEINIILETMLTEAEHELRQGNYTQVEVLISSADRVLSSGSFVDPLAQSFRDIIHQATEWGFEVHRLNLKGNQATALVTNPYSPNLITVDFAQGSTGWVLLR